MQYNAFRVAIPANRNFQFFVLFIMKQLNEMIKRINAIAERILTVFSVIPKNELNEPKTPNMRIVEVNAPNASSRKMYFGFLYILF